MRELQASSSTPLRDKSQQPLFIVAPLDVLVTRGDGRNTCHIIEINGTGASVASHVGLACMCLLHINDQSDSAAAAPGACISMAATSLPAVPHAMPGNTASLLHNASSHGSSPHIVSDSFAPTTPACTHRYCWHHQHDLRGCADNHGIHLRVAAAAAAPAGPRHPGCELGAGEPAARQQVRCSTAPAQCIAQRGKQQQQLAPLSVHVTHELRSLLWAEHPAGGLAPGGVPTHLRFPSSLLLLGAPSRARCAGQCMRRCCTLRRCARAGRRLGAPAMSQTWRAWRSSPAPCLHLASRLSWVSLVHC